MRPPICDLCSASVKFKDNYKDFLVKFSDYEDLPPRMVGHPKGLLWFCDKHIKNASNYTHLSSSDALKAMREDLGI